MLSSPICILAYKEILSLIILLASNSHNYKFIFEYGIIFSIRVAYNVYDSSSTLLGNAPMCRRWKNALMCVSFNLLGKCTNVRDLRLTWEIHRPAQAPARYDNAAMFTNFGLLGKCTDVHKLRHTWKLQGNLIKSCWDLY